MGANPGSFVVARKRNHSADKVGNRNQESSYHVDLADWNEGLVSQLNRDMLNSSATEPVTKHPTEIVTDDLRWIVGMR